MPETCIKFGKHGARVMIEDREVEHYAIEMNPDMKEVTCWIPSEEGKVRELYFRYCHHLVHLNKSRTFQLYG